ncbi:hypothetical protein SETIT_5G267300v2 [Setaria italica]|uniref:Profilin n=1 Tax=Setaria italica TaxID=4555 RepID=A0A368R935_SETIT|nr:uncharacterized protein LOC101768414 isoform X2 [Setaria italica]RCV26701.1 hypothetical protein SETIT_5G267300v2 [Setaria italica]
MAADWLSARRAWEKWTTKHVGPSGKQVQAALLLNYDPSGPSRLLPVIAEQEGTQLTAIDMRPFLDFVKRGNLQTEFFSIRPNQYLVTSIHDNWYCARCVNSTKSVGEGAIVMQIGAYLLVCMMVLLLQLHKQWWLLISLQCSLTGELTNFLLV